MTDASLTAGKAADDETPPDVRVAGIALAGTSIEWYDFFIYGTAASLVFPALFFATGMSPLVAQIAAFGTFAVGFIARPIGAIIFSNVGDRVGRKTALVIALFLMGAATTLIGLLPTYHTIGFWAPLLLTTLRFMQGIAIGGQWGGAILLVTETAPRHRRGFYGAFAQAGGPMGVVLANGVFLIVSYTVSQEAFMNWGWRVPFLLSATLIALAVYAEMRVEETPAFKQLKEKKAAMTKNEPVVKPERMPILEAFVTYPKEIFLTAGALAGVLTPYYILITFVITYGTDPAGLQLSRNAMLLAVWIGAALMVPATFIAGHLSDIYGRRTMNIIGAVFIGVWGFAIFPLIDTGNFFWIVTSISLGLIPLGVMYGPQGAMFAELYSTHIRYSGASLGYQLGAILGGAFAPIIATALYGQAKETLGISIYIAIISALAVVSVWCLRETKGCDMNETKA